MKVLISRGLSGEFLGGAELEILDVINTSPSDVHYHIATNSKELINRSVAGSTYLENWPNRADGVFSYLGTLKALGIEMNRIINKQKPDIIVCQSREDLLVFAGSSTPVFLRDHGDLRHMLRSSRTNPVASLFQNKYVKKLESISGIFVHNKNEIEYISHFIKNTPLIEMRSGIVMPEKIEPKDGGDKLIIGVVSRLVEDKGVQNFIEALSLLPKKTAGQIKPRVVGDGEFRSDLEQQASASGVDVEFLGYIEDRDTAYSGLDIIVHPSLSEGWGRTLGEGLSYGIPAIASDLPSYKQQLGDTGAGIFYSKNDPKELSEAIVKLVDNEKLRKEMKTKSVTRAKEIADINPVVNDVFLPSLKEAL